MGKKAARSFNAKTLRIFLSIMLLISTAVGVVGFIYGQRLLQGYAVEVSHKKIDAEASNNNLQSLEKMEEELADNKDVLEKISLLRATSDFPEFRVVEEINKIAQRNGVTITSYQYTDGTTPSTGTSTATPSAPPTTTPPTGTTTTPAASSSAAGKTISLLITPESPMNYRQFLQFLYDIEQNLPKMKVAGISISPGSTPTAGGSGTGTRPTDSNQVSVGQLTVQLYIN
jgi:hypothetical protein